MKIGTIMQTGDYYYVPLEYNWFERNILGKENCNLVVKMDNNTGLYFTEDRRGRFNYKHPVTKAINNFKYKQLF